MPVVLNSMVSGVLFYTAYQFLFIGLQNRKHPEYITFGLIVFLQAGCALIELFGILSDNQQTYLNYRQLYFNFTAVINVLFFFFISFISGYKHKKWLWTYLFSVLLTFIISNATPAIVFINHAPVYHFPIIESNFSRPWTVNLTLTFSLINALQYIILTGFSLQAFRFRRLTDIARSHFILFTLFLFMLGITSDMMIDLGIIHSPVSSYFYLILIIYISTQLYRNIENAKRFQDEASQGEQQLRQIIDLAPNLIFAKDSNGRFLLANKAVADFYGTTSEELRGRTQYDFFHVNEEIDFFRQKDLEVMNSDQSIIVPEETITDKDGNLRILQTVKIPFSYYGSKAVLGVSTDITSLKESETLAKSNQQLFETIFETASVAMVLMDQSTTIVKINQAGKELGIIADNDVLGLQPGNAFNCINAYGNEQGCGHSKECFVCTLRTSIKTTFTTRKSINNAPFKMTLKSRNEHTYKDILLSTSYFEINNSPMVVLVLEDITSMKRAEMALTDSEFRYRQITRAISDYIYTVIYENDEIKTIHTSACIFITGYSAEEFEENPSLWFEIIVDEDRENVLNLIRNEPDSTENRNLEHRIIHKDGSERWVSNTLVKKNRKGKLAHYDGIIRNITKRKRAERELDNQNKLLNTMLGNLPVGIFMIDALDGTPLIANEHAKKLLGNGILPGVSPTNLSKVYNAFKAGTDQIYPMEKMPIYQGLQGNYGSIDDMEIEHPDGSRTLLEIVGCPVYDNNNKIWASLVGFHDITARKNAEAALRESEKKLSITFEYSHVGISLSDCDGNIEYMNPAFCRLLDYDPDQIVGNSFLLFADPNDVETEIKMFSRLRNGELNMLNFEKKYIKKDGGEVWVQLQVSCFRNAKGEATNFIAVAEDITERKSALDSLRASEEKFKNIFNTSNDALLIVDLESHILEVNQLFLDRTGLTTDNFKNLRLIDIIFPNDKEEAENQIKNLEKNKTGFFQTSYINQRGEKIYIEINGRTINYNSQPAAMLVSRDITDRVILQQKILNAIIEAEEKERSFFSQELHDGLGPILSTIKLYLEWIQNPNAKSDKSVLLTEALNTIEEAIVGIKEISNRLSPNVLKKFGLETAIQSFIKKMESLEKVNFTVNISTPNRMRPEIEAMLYRVFVEAINNSLKYAKASNIIIKIEANMYGLFASYHDDGIGFNTNEALMRKNGHGLFNMQNRVETYEGIFVLKSDPGKGTEIEIEIPTHKYTLTNS